MTDLQSWQREWARQLREENRWRRKAMHRAARGIAGPDR